MTVYEMAADGSLVLGEKEKPVATADNLIVEIKRASICGTDVRTYTKGSTKIDAPRTLGHELAGEIVHVGGAVQTDYVSGDRVMLAPAIGCGECHPCRQGHTNMCDDLQTIGFQHDGAFAKYIEVPRQALRMGNLIGIPAQVSYGEAAIIEPVGCALNAQQYVEVQTGDYVVIYGAGFIGCVHAELSRLRGAAQVIVVEPAEKRGRQAVEMIEGLTWINPAVENTTERVAEVTGGRGADVVIVANSVPSCQVEAQEIAAKMGRISLFGGLVGESTGYIDSNAIHYKELQISGVHATTPALMAEVLAMVAAGELDLAKYISAEVPLEDIEKGFEMILNENIMKVVVAP